MPIQTNLNVSPYFEDFDPNKEYYRVLFRPSVPVQARELTQLQTILQTQIERFGNWAFKNGDIVYGCSLTDIPVMPFVRLDDYQLTGAGVPISNLQFTRVVSASSNLQAKVIMATSGLASQYPNTNIVYLNYLNSGTNGEKTFSNTDTLYFYNSPLTGNAAVDNVATVNVYANVVANQISIGNAHGISVTDGIIFLNGNFVKVVNTVYGVVNNFGTYAGNNTVGFVADENIITADIDSTLNDNALGYPNYNAPGADRLQVLPQLLSLDPVTAANTANFNPIATYNFGALVQKQSNNDVQSIVAEALAKRVYEEAGNFVVNPFVFDSVTATPDPNVVPSSTNNVLIKVGTGLGYSYGNRVSLDKPAHINIRRGVDTQVNKSQIITFNYGNYFVLDEVAGSFDYANSATVYLYDSPQMAVTNKVYTSLTPSGNLIGTAQARCFTYAGSGYQGTNNALYYLNVFNINISNGYSIANVASVYSNNAGVFGVADLNIPGIQSASLRKQLFSFGVPGIKALRDASNNNNTEYTYRSKKSTTLVNDGTITVTIPTSVTGGVDQLPYGNAAIIPINSLPEISVFAYANGATANLSGTVTVSTSSSNVTGSSTTFTNDFVPGDVIVTNGSDIRTVVLVSNNTNMLVDAPFSNANGGSGYYKKIPAGKQLSFSPTSYVQVTNTSSFTIHTNDIPTGSIAVTVDYDVLRTTASPAIKVINKNRWVKIDTTSNPNGPWCLGFSDIHKINAVYNGTSGGTPYSNTNTDVTNYFTFDTGQKDTHYDLGYLYSKGGFQTNNYPYLLVNLDYFVPNTTPGVGFFTVESYPIDDVNTSNTNAIQTKDIPLFVDQLGNKISLRDYVDFRPVAASTATDTTDYSSASVNPANTLSFNVPVTGLNVPAYSKNLQADYTIYLPRVDLIYMNPDGVLKVKEGVSSLTPVTPIYPDNLLTLSTINIPAYPSLSTDQFNSQISINSQCVTQCRDASNRITASVLTNRRYTMKDIGKLDNRITNLEYYAQLSMLQQQTKDLTVTDANGLDRFKNGIFVEPFSDFTLSDVSNPEFNVSLDMRNGIARPKFWTEAVFLEFNNSSTTQKTGTLVTLPYNESPTFISQPYATKYRSASHVAFAWNGTVTLYPALIDQMQTTQGNTINMTVDTATPWEQFANSPMGTSWGGWEITDQSLTSNTTYQQTSVGTVQNVTANVWLGFQNGGSLQQSISGLTSNSASLYNYLVQNGINVSPDFVIGNQSNNYQGHDSSPPAGSIDSTKYSWNQTSAAAAQAQAEQAQNATTALALAWMFWSDKRLKKDITLIGKLTNGINLYKYRYVWSNNYQIGVMAQELINIMPEAVIETVSGYLKVDYKKLGFKPVTI